tara:strand:+ start:8301 stop:8702 length:402 start_codon:yes stop_codon:yes gene_type:complete
LISYEGLKNDPQDILKKLFDQLEININADEINQIVQDNSIQSYKNNQNIDTTLSAKTEPEGFYGNAEEDEWKSKLTNSQIKLIEYICAEQMEEYGYSLTSRALKKPIRLRLKEVVGAIAWRIKTFADFVYSSI